MRLVIAAFVVGVVACVLGVVLLVASDSSGGTSFTIGGVLVIVGLSIGAGLRLRYGTRLERLRDPVLDAAVRKGLSIAEDANAKRSNRPVIVLPDSNVKAASTEMGVADEVERDKE